MKIEITQDDRGFDVVTIDGVVASTEVTAIMLDAVDCIETCKYNEAAASWEEHHCSFCGKPLSSSPEHAAGFCNDRCYGAYTEGGSYDNQYGPEDGGICPCGGVNCDGTCEPPF